MAHALALNANHPLLVWKSQARSFSFGLFGGRRKSSKIGDRPLTVLAVDDDALVLMNTTLMLEDLGHQVLEAYSGQEALSALKQADNRIDLVITDHSMPRMTGAELAATIATEWPGLPVVLATGYAELPDGSGNHLPRLPKPFSQAQLSDIIASVTGSTV